MTPLHELATQLLVGSDRRPPDWPLATGELGELLTRIGDGAEPLETRALRMAGVLAVCAEAGVLPPPAGQPALPPCPPERRPPVDAPALVATLGHILDEGPDPLRAEALRRLGAAGRTLPPGLLPRALALATRHAWPRPLLPAVVGERGRWLVQHVNPAWSVALAADEECPEPAWWDEGNLEQRLRFLTVLRRQDPAEARRRLAATFAETDARGRARLLGTLTIGLGADDEAFLETCLRDRAKEVRQQAVSLLARLPEGRYLARMGERLAGCMTRTRTLPRQRLTLEPPAAFDPAWKQDGIEEAPPQGDALGPRAWWLYQMARLPPLQWWNAHTELDPAACIRWAKGGDWELALARAWLEALARAPSADWAEALLNRLPIKGLRCDPFELIDRLPAPVREAHWLALLQDPPRGVPFGDQVARIAQTLAREGGSLSVPFAQAVLDQTRQRLVQGFAAHDHGLRRALPEFICALPEEVLDQAGRDWPSDRLEAQGFAETLAQVLAVIQRRQILIHHLQESPRP